MADEPSCDLEEAVTDFWKLVERFPKSFVEKFLSKVEAASWRIEDDPSYEVPKKLMLMLLEEEKKNSDGKEEKEWSPMQEAINDFWKHFATQESKDLKHFCSLLKDDRFSEGFISGFTRLLDEKWDSTLDSAVALMTSHFKKFKTKIRKKNRHKGQRKRDALEKLAAQADEEAKRDEKLNEEECKISVLTEEQVEENRALRRKKIEKQQKVYEKVYLKQQAARREEFNKYRARKEEADLINHLRNEYKNCREFKTHDDALEEDKDQ